MKVISAATANYEVFINGLRKACKKVNMPCQVYGLGEDTEFADESFVAKAALAECSGFESRDSVIISKSPFKPDIIRHALQQHNEPVVWMDADVVPLWDVSDVFDEEFDIAVTVRRPSERENCPWVEYAGLLNAGVIFCNNTPNMRSFIEEWIEKIPQLETKTDQQALAHLLWQMTDFLLDDLNTIVTHDGFRIKLLTTDEYNFYYMNESLHPHTKIVHIKASAKHTEYLEKYEQYMKEAEERGAPQDLWEI